MRNAYLTKQKTNLEDYLSGHIRESYTVDELTQRLSENGESVGRTTVYRHLEQLSEQGHVRKYTGARGNTLYQYIEDGANCRQHFHLMCRKCSRLFHVECEMLGEFSRHIASEHGFVIDPKESILVGLCADCQRAEADSWH